jgi:hypothetical protein
MVVDMNKTSPRIQTLLIILLVATLSLAVLKYANPHLYPPGRDGGAYMFGARHLTHGKTLYVDYWEAKGPMIFFINALGLLVGNDSRWGIWLIEYLFWFFSALLGILTLRKQFGLVPTFFGVIMMLMVGQRLIGSGNYTEEYSLLFTWISVFAFFQHFSKPTSRLYPIIMGSMLAINFFIRANNVITTTILIAIGLWHAIRTLGFKAGWRYALYIAVGGMPITLLVVGFFLVNGTLDEMFIASILYNFAYSFGARPGLRNLNIFASGLLPARSSLGAWMLLPLIGFFCAAIPFIQKLCKKRLDLILLLLSILWPLEMLASAISGRNYGHYFLTWLPIIALLSAYAIHFLNTIFFSKTNIQPLPHWTSTLALGLTLLLFTAIFHQDLWHYVCSISRLVTHPKDTHEYTAPVSAFIAENSAPEDLVLVWGGQTGINFMSQRFSPTAYNFYPLYANSRIGRQLQVRYLADLQRNRPKLIVDAHIHAPDVLPIIYPGYRSRERVIYPVAENTDKVLDYIVANYALIYDQDGYQIFEIQESDQK